MKYVLLLAVGLLSLSQTIATAQPKNNIAEYQVESRAPQDAVQLLSAFNPLVVDHFYTTNASELDFILRYYGFGDEGTATGYLYPNEQPGTVPLFRLYSLGLTDHLYTTLQRELDKAVGDLGYTSEGVVGYVYPSAGAGRIPLYRLYNSGAADHFYTTATHERDDAAKNGWTDEGVVGYIFPS